MDYQKYIDKSISYEEYMELIEKMAEANKTSGENQSLDLVEYTKLNLRRMKRLDKTTVINKDLLAACRSCEERIIWLVLTESWCGDAAQNIPLIHQLAKANDCIELKLIFRDENLELMDEHLTNGGRSIPKLIALRQSDLKVLGTWGPRPEKAQNRIHELKKNPNISHEDLVKETQLWYARDKGESLQAEFTTALSEWKEKAAQ